MSAKSDAIPEPILGGERSKRQTLEFCNDELEGFRCMLSKGHEGMHECLANQGPLRWDSRRAS